MTDGQYLLLLFVALYLFESLRWLPPRSRLIVGSGLRWQIRQPFDATEIRGYSPVLESILPPLQTHLFTLPWLYAPAAGGLEIQPDQKRPPLLIPWATLKLHVDEQCLDLAPGQRLRFLSNTQAQHAKKQIQQWTTQTQAEREADFLQHAAATLAPAPLAAHAAELTQQTRSLRVLGSIIFLWTFGVLVGLYRWQGDSVLMLVGVGGLFLLQWCQAVLFFRKAKGLPYRFWKALAMALLPQHAMRAADHFSKPTDTETPHPLASYGLLAEDAWKKQALSFWRNTHYRKTATADLQSQALTTFFTQQGVALADLETIPTKLADSASYCPNCQTQFQAGTPHCKDCGGIPLRAF